MYSEYMSLWSISSDAGSPSPVLVAISDADFQLLVAPQHYRDAIRLASVVSELTKIQSANVLLGSLTNLVMPDLAGHLNGVCVYGLLFLPAAGTRDGTSFDRVGRALFYVVSGRGRFMHAQVAEISASYALAWLSHGMSVRLASVVSELAFLSAYVKNRGDRGSSLAA